MNEERLTKKLEKAAKKARVVRKIDKKKFEEAKKTLLKSLRLGGGHGWHSVEVELEGIKIFEKTL